MGKISGNKKTTINMSIMDFKKKPYNKKSEEPLKWLAIKAVYNQSRRS